MVLDILKPSGRLLVRAPMKQFDLKDGVLQLHVDGGIYQEYVSVAYNKKKNITMTGDAMNIITTTGNRSVGDVWKTDKSW